MFSNTTYRDIVFEKLILNPELYWILSSMIHSEWIDNINFVIIHLKI